MIRVSLFNVAMFALGWIAFSFVSVLVRHWWRNRKQLHVEMTVLSNGNVVVASKEAWTPEQNKVVEAAIARGVAWAQQSRVKRSPYGDDFPPLKVADSGTVAAGTLLPKPIVDGNGKIVRVEFHWVGFGGIIDSLPPVCVMTRAQVFRFEGELRSALDKTESWSFKGHEDDGGDGAAA